MKTSLYSLIVPALFVFTGCGAAQSDEFADSPSGEDEATAEEASELSAATKKKCASYGAECVSLSVISATDTVIPPSKLKTCKGVGVACRIKNAAPTSCVGAGGTCVGLHPDACPAPGHFADSTLYSCGSGIGVACCLP